MTLMRWLYVAGVLTLIAAVAVILPGHPTGAPVPNGGRGDAYVGHDPPTAHRECRCLGSRHRRDPWRHSAGADWERGASHFRHRWSP